MYNTRKERFEMTKREVPTYRELTTPRKELTKPGTRLFLHLHSVLALFLAVFLPGFPISFIHVFLGGVFHPTIIGKIQHIITGILLLAIQRAFFL